MKNFNQAEFKLSLIEQILKTDFEHLNDKNLNMKENLGDLFVKDFVPLVYSVNYFDDELPPPIVIQGIKEYSDLNISGPDSFNIDFKDFDNLIEAHDSYKYCKFYLLDDGGKLNIGLSFSNNYELTIDTVTDDLYILSGDKFISQDFSRERDEFLKEDGIRAHVKNKIPDKDPTEMIQFEKSIIREYNQKVSYAFNIKQLKFTMLKFPSDYKDKYGNKYKQDRVSFSVSSIIDGSVAKEAKEFDAGDLKP